MARYEIDCRECGDEIGKTAGPATVAVGVDGARELADNRRWGMR